MTDAAGGFDLFKKLMKEAKRECHPGSHSMMWLAFIMRVIHIKTYTHMTNRAFDVLFKLLKMASPEVDFPKSYIDANKAISDVGIDYETIRVCKYDSTL